MINNLVKLKDYVPFFQTTITVVLILILLLIFRKAITQLVSIICSRIKEGSSFEAGPIKIGQALKELPHIVQDENIDKNDLTENEREKERSKIYKDNSSLFLAHVLVPSDRKGYRYDIYIYLVRHKSKDLSIEIQKHGFNELVNKEIYSNSKTIEEKEIKYSLFMLILQKI